MRMKQRQKKLFEKVLAFLLVLTMCAGMLPVQTLAVEKDKAIAQNETVADWKMQNFGSDTDLTIQDGWMTPDETGDGVLVDYGKIYQDVGGNVVVYDNAAPIYQDSILEFDVTVTGGQANKYQVAFFPRFQSGKNCDGFAVGEKAQLQHSYQVNGQEGWPGVDNNLGMSFEVDQTYHIKMVTAGNTMSVYVGDKLLTSFETRSEITDGKYGFRIWTQSDVKTVHFENIKRSEYISSKLDKKEEIIKSDDWGKEDVVIPVSFGKDDAVDTIKNGDQELTEGTDYTIDGSTITLKKEYIEKQADSFALNILFAKGSEDSFKVTRLDTTIKEHIWTPEQGLDEWNKIAGNGTYTLEEDGLHIKGETKLMNTASPSVMNGEIEMTFDQLTDNNYIGFLFGAKENGTWQGVMKDDDYVLSRWYYHNSDGNRTGFHGDGSFLLSRDGEADTKLKLRFQGQTLSMWLDDQFMYTGSVSQVKDTMGKMGLLTGSKCDIVVKKVVFRSVLPFMAETDDSGDKIIAKDGMNVTLADDFPRVKEYDLNGKKMDGAEFKYNYVTINSVDYPATATIAKESDDSITYTVEPEGSDVKFDVVFTVLDNHILDMHIKNIEEPKGELVYSIGLPNQPLISANSNQSGARLDASGFIEAMGAFHNSQLSDFHYNINENKISKTADGLATIPVITTDELSASMANNVLLNIQEFRFRAFDLEDGSVSAGFWNNEFMYRGLDGEKLFPIASEPEEENLYCQIILTEDTNADGTMDWQDGANALKELVGDRIPGGEDAARSFFEVGYNFVSEAQQPFIKVGDNLKRMSNLIDGFDQILILKGYANEGHDSGHADYDDINKRAGGAEDLNAMTEAIKDINATFGIHINHTEAYPEAEMYNDHVVSNNNAWSWMDQSQNIRREVDILNTAEGQRTMDERLNSMFEKAPGIDFVYVDTYTDDRWCETRIANNLISNGAMIGTENQNDFNRYNSWVHWPEINANSMHHFVYHTQKDVYGSASSPIYWGGYARAESFMSWQHRNNINPIVKQFYTNQLPQKYLMCHELLKDDGSTGYFEGNVTSSNYQIRKDGNLLTDGQGKIFIPWFAEDSETRNPDEAAKIYHWNDQGGDTTWTLPENWSNLSNVYLYKTTQTGKKLVDTIEVVDGQVTIHADAQTPYVVYPGEAEPDTTKWSEGSPLEDGSFNSRDFSVWEKSGNADIQFNDDSNGVSILTMGGTEEGAVSQTMEGLVPGQKYRAVVWAGSENGKTARITVETPDGKTHMNYVDQIVRGNNCFDTYAQGKRVERVWIDFVQPEGETTAKITFSADACENSNGQATFMESRLVKTAEPDLPEGYVANETFEYVEQGGTGIFTPEGGGDGGYHLSHYTEYTDDAININGEWSLKMYGSGSANMRTYPATMRLEPNTEYSMEFDALGYGNVTVESESNSADKPLTDTFEEGHNTYTFVTGDKTDYIVRIADGSNKVLDNFKVYTVNDPTAPSVPGGLTVNAKDGGMDLSWEEAVDEDTGVSAYNVYRDDKLIATVTETNYRDTNVSEYTTYSYQVSAVNAGKTESERSEIVKGYSGTDLSAPKIVSAKLDGTTHIAIVFNEMLDKKSAENISNYTLSDGAKVSKAQLQEDGKTVNLTVAGLPINKAFLVTATGVQDVSVAKNACTGESPVQLSVVSRYFKFDEEDAEAAYDSTGQENGVKTNVGVANEGFNGNAGDFNTNGGVQISGKVLTDAPEWTFSAWINWDGNPTESQTIMGNDVSGSPTAGMWFHIRTDKKLWASPYDGSRGVDLTSSQTVPVGEWTHVAITFKDKEFVMYFNGKETARAKFDTYPDSVTNPVNIGSHYNSGSSMLHEFGGMIDEAKIYRVALNAEQIEEDALNTKFRPETVGAHFVVNKASSDDLGIAVVPNAYTLSRVTLDGKEVDAQNYVMSETMLTVKNAYLVSLEAGLHKIELVFENTLGNTETVELDLTVIEGNKIVDKSKLYELLSKVSNLSKEDYTNESWMALSHAVKAAQKVFENRDASQEEVNNAQTALEKAMGALEEKGLSTDVLEYAIELGKSADAKGVIDSVKAAFEQALADAEKMLADVNAGVTGITQADVDTCWQNLIKAMQYLSFKQGNKTDLEKVVALAADIEGRLDSYLDDGKQAFVDALAAAKETLEDGDAMQDEVNQAWTGLLEAMANLRLKPDKSGLETLINEASALSEDAYEAESFGVMRTALAGAREVFADENADQKAVAAAETNLKDAVAKLVPVSGGAKADKNDTVKESADKQANAAGTADTATTVNANHAAKSAKTGDAANPMAAAAMMAAAMAAVAVVRKKRR